MQFVRKISGYRQPSRGNAAAFDRVVGDDAALAARALPDALASK